eukprot:c18012_g1_i1.p1 GENE.c18012_g1_i1~~c18012_g1_i1.p1  ORF type:complete len:610 (+),score=128.35 c18012_g1_i1:493-2322(+)
MEKRYKSTSETAGRLIAQVEKKDKEIEALTSELNLIKENSLQENKARVALLDDRLAAAEISIQSRDSRITSLSDLLRQERQLSLSKQEQLAQTQGKLQTVEDVDMQAKGDEISILKENINRLEVVDKEKQARIETLHEKFMSQKEELKMRIEQIRLLFEKVKSKEEEIQTLTDRNTFVETQMQTQQSVVEGLQTRLASTNDTLQKTREELGDARALIKKLEIQIEGINDELARKSDEALFIKGESSNTESTAKNKEERITQLHSRIETLRNQLIERDNRVADLSKTVTKFESQELEWNNKLKQFEEEKEKNSSSLKETEELLSQARNELSKRDADLATQQDKVKIFGDRLTTANEDAAKQVASLEGKIKTLELQIVQKEEVVEKTLKQLASGSSDGVHSKESALQDKLTRTEGLVKAKESLIQLLNEKLRAANQLAKVKEEEAKNVISESTQKVSKATADLEKTTETVIRLEEELRLKDNEIQAQQEAVTRYSQMLVSAEASVSGHEENMRKLIDQMKDDRQKLQEINRTVEQTNEASQDQLELQAKIDNLSLLYFQTVCILVKSQLLASGRMQNVTIKELYEEVKANHVEVEEWPTYIFARAFGSAAA